LLLTPFFLVVSVPAWAQRLESDSYVIQFGNFNVTSGEKESASYNVTDTVGQTFAGPFGAYGSSDYFIGAGFQYIYQIDTFAFSISDVDIDLGSLTPGAHNTASNTLRITTKGAGGYTVYAYELHPLRHSNGTNDIDDTLCDTGACSESNADPWTTLTVTGFGFNASGNDVPADFVDSTYFRQFADREDGETMQVVMSDDDIADNEEATITYKAGVSGTQAAGDYQTGVVYVAVPGF
ncbi:MAG TPA: hypothetical protein VF209_02470, partial [Patescibacteria group bacterium]